MVWQQVVSGSTIVGIGQNGESDVKIRKAIGLLNEI